MSQPDLIITPFGENAAPGTIEPIPETKGPTDPPQKATWNTGFPSVTMMPLAAGGLPPRGQDINGVLKAISEHTVFQGSGGQYRWSQEWVDAHGGYPKGAVLQSDDGAAAYVSTIENNSVNFNTTPSSVGNEWARYSGDLFPNAQSATPGNGGLLVDNRKTGTGLERVLTESDLGGGGEHLTPRYQVFPAVQRAMDASLYTKQQPPAIYDAVSNRTFLAYAGPGRDVWIIYYDHSIHTWSQPQKVADNPIRDSKGVEDDHGAPAISLDGDGYIHILYGSHASKGYWAKSTEPRNIGSWVVQELSGISAMTYAGIALDEATGDLYSFFRAGVSHGSSYPAHEFGGLMRLPLGGSAWQEVPGGIIDTTGYPGSASDVYPTDIRVRDGRVYVGWLISDGSTHNDVRKDVYAAYYSIADGNMYSVGGANLGPRVEFSDRAAVLIHGSDYTEGPKLEFGAEGRIYAVFCKAISDTEGSGHFVSVWDGSSWATHDTGARTNYFFFSGQLRVKGDGSLELFVPVGGDAVDTPFVSSASGTENIDRKFGASVAVYTSSAEGNAWALDQIVARKDQISHQGARVVSVPRNSHPGLKCIFSAASADKSDWLVPIYAVTDEQYEPSRVADMLTLIPREGTVYCNYSNENIVQVANPGSTYQEVDVSDLVSSNAYSVIIEVIVDGSSGATYPKEWVVGFKRAGSPRARDSILRIVAHSGEAQGEVIEVPLSFDHKFEFASLLGGVSQIQLRLLAYKTM